MKADNGQWSEWIEWSGGKCPVNPSTIVQWKGRGTNHEGSAPIVAGDLRWDRFDSVMDIIAYRYLITEESAGISDAAEEEALQEAYERIKKQDHGDEVDMLNRKLAGLNADKSGLQLLCVEQADEIGRLKSQLRRIREISREFK